MAEDRVYEEVYLPGSRRKTRILVKPNEGQDYDKTAQMVVDTLNHHSEHSDTELKVGAVTVADSVEEAEDWAAKEAEAAHVTPSAVMHSAPEGYGSGARDQDQGTLTEDRVETLLSKDPFELASEVKENVELPDAPRVGLTEEDQAKGEVGRTSEVKDVEEAEKSPILVATGADKHRSEKPHGAAKKSTATHKEAKEEKSEENK
jgi:hypothetical protein